MILDMLSFNPDLSIYMPLKKTYYRNDGIKLNALFNIWLDLHFIWASKYQQCYILSENNHDISFYGYLFCILYMY